MRRRNVLLSAAAMAATGTLYRLRSRPREVTVAVWFSPEAARYDALPARIGGYLRRTLGEPFDAVEVRYGDEPVPLPREGGERVMTELWPRMVLQGLVEVGPVDTVSDVNLLVTAGDPGAALAGYGMRRIAAISGAHALSEMPPSTAGTEVVEPSVPATVTQLLLHECGHALGLDHRHGSVRVDDEEAVASPMVGRYAWSPTAPDGGIRSWETDVCGEAYPEDVAEKRRRLSLRYGPCARRALRRDR